MKKGAKIGSRVYIGAGSVIPENASVESESVLVEGWNGSSVKESTKSKTQAETEARHVYSQALFYHSRWSRSREQLEQDLRDFKFNKENIARIIEGKPTWDTFTPTNPNPIREPNRRGLIYDKN